MERIESVDDPRVAAYRNLRDRTLRGESLFVTEGRVLTRRLLESPYAAESVFVADGYLEEFRGLVPSGVPIYVAAREAAPGGGGLPISPRGAGGRSAPGREIARGAALGQ